MTDTKDEMGQGKARRQARKRLKGCWRWEDMAAMRGRGWRKERMFTGPRGKGGMCREPVVKNCRVQANDLQLISN